MREHKETLENIVKMYKEGKIIFKCDNCESSDFKLMLNYKLPLPIIPVIVLHNGNMLCYNELLYYFVRCICGEDTSQEYSKLEGYKQNIIESKWVNILCYEPFNDSFSEEELKFSFEIFNDKKYTSEFFNDYCKELNKLSKTLEKYE